MHNAAVDGATLAAGAVPRVEAVGAVPPAADVVSRAEAAGAASRVVDATIRAEDRVSPGAGVALLVGGVAMSEAVVALSGVGAVTAGDMETGIPLGSAMACLTDTEMDTIPVTATMVIRMRMVPHTLAIPQDFTINGATSNTTLAATGISAVLPTKRLALSACLAPALVRRSQISQFLCL
jgi:hypothetical protein